jgi:hypothetical protein
MDRTKAIFNHIFSLPAGPSALRSSYLNQNKYNLLYHTTSSGLQKHIYDERSKREAKSLQDFLENTRHKFKDLNELHNWLFTEHQAYTSSRLSRSSDEIDPVLLKSY